MTGVSVTNGFATNFKDNLIIIDNPAFLKHHHQSNLENSQYAPALFNQNALSESPQRSTYQMATLVTFLWLLGNGKTIDRLEIR